ncbi:MAG: transposase family protein [Acutalibacteraceae bacterium]
MELRRKACKCPECSAETDKIHDYRTQIIKDIPIKEKKVFILTKSKFLNAMLTITAISDVFVIAFYIYFVK